MIYELSDASAQDARLTGGKAAALAKLMAAGFPVPEGFVVAVDAGNIDKSGITGLADRLIQLEARWGPDARFAVRSSGFSEDSAETSFAGQYDSVLGVRGMQDISAAIDRCFASFSSLRAGAYREGRDTGRQGGAVIVQELVAAEAAGVAFTVDPITGSRDRVLIEANFGLGESVVGGQVTPDGFAVMKATNDIVDRRIGDKRRRCVLDASGTRLEDVPDHLRRHPSLADDAIRSIACLARNVEENYGAPVDIEWAWSDGKAYLLQARPVTTLSTVAAIPPDWSPELNTRIDARFPLYSSGNVSEILPGCVTPLTYSLFSRGIERAFRDMAESIGSMPDIGKEPIVVGFFFHRIYLNASYFMTAAENSPGASPDTVYEELIGQPVTRQPAWKWHDLRPRRFIRGLGIIGRFLSLQRRLAKDIAACRLGYEENRSRFEKLPPAQWSNDELARWVDVSDAGFEPVIVHIRASQFATSSFATLKGMTRRWLNDADGALASTLVSGIGSIAGASPAAGLYELSRLVSQDPSLRELFARESDDELLASSIRLREALASFLDRFGHRGFREAEFRNPCWREQPSAVIGQLRTHLEPGSLAPAAIAERQLASSSRARETALARLPRIKRGIFLSVLDSARKHIAAREEMKDLLLRFMDLTRKVIAAAQTRLADVLDRADDIYFLLDREAAAALRGEISREAVRDIVRRRRLDFERSSRVFVPKIQNGLVRRLDRPEEVPAGEDVRELCGVPVSPGYAEGPARIVLDPTRASLAPGEILVAPVTDVAWTPLFLRAAGLVVEVGGPLSHGSIVAREYGIPAVTAVHGATRRIRTGDRLRVDGNNGVVAIVGPSRKI